MSIFWFFVDSSQDFIRQKDHTIPKPIKIKIEAETMSRQIRKQIRPTELLKPKIDKKLQKSPNPPKISP